MMGGAQSDFMPIVSSASSFISLNNWNRLTLTRFYFRKEFTWAGKTRPGTFENFSSEGRGVMLLPSPHPSKEALSANFVRKVSLMWTYAEHSTILIYTLCRFCHVWCGTLTHCTLRWSSLPLYC